MTDHEPPVRVRIAPSPTGYMHVGTARTALFNWLYARRRGGTFVLRVEDTDRNRFVPDALQDLLDGLRWLGLDPDEGPEAGGAYGPYFQSERLALYREHAEALLENRHAYRCFCSSARLEQVRAERAAGGLKLGYDRRCRGLSSEEVARRQRAGEPSVVRLAMPLTGTITLHDRIRGPIAFDATELEDVVLLKSDGYPTYHLAVVVDDHLMRITHVLRADEWISSAPIQVRLFEVLGWPEPVWAHLPLVLNPGGQGKLSKRKTVSEGPASEQVMTQVREYREAGYLPEAMANFLALLGWAYSGDEEVFTMEAATERFDLDGVRPAPSAWDPEKLAWMNGAYIRSLDPGDLADRLLPFLHRAGLPAHIDEVRRMAPLVQERLETLRDGATWLSFFWADTVHPDPEELVPKQLDHEGAARVLRSAAIALEELGPWVAAAIEDALRSVAAELDLKAGPAFHPVRVAVTGQRVSPPLFETLEILGREAAVLRLRQAEDRLTRTEPGVRR